MADDKIFPDEFVPNIQGAQYHPRWIKANPAENEKWVKFRDDIVAHKNSTPPAMSTKYGKALVAAGKLHMSVTDIGSVPPDLPPEPPPVTTVGAYGINCSKWFDASHNPSRMLGLGAKVARIEYDISEAASSLDNWLGQIRNVGIRSQVQCGFYGRLPTVTEATTNLASWASRHGPTGTNSFNKIEFGNETSYSYQYGESGSWWASSTYITRAQNYALRARDAAQALAPYGVGLLVQAEDGGSGSSNWVDNMFLAVPNLASYVAGWVIHPYGPTSGPTRISRMLTQLAAKGETSKPVYITEWGIASDNGRALTTGNNYGNGTSVTYTQASNALDTAAGNWASILGTRWAQTIIFTDQNGAAQGGPSVDTEAFYGATNLDGTAKGAYTTNVTAKLTASPIS